MVEQTLRALTWITAAALAASACLPSEGTCEGGGTRVGGVCECPEGTTENGSRCAAVAHDGAEAGTAGMHADASSGGDDEAAGKEPSQDADEEAGIETDGETSPRPEPEDSGGGSIDADGARDANAADTSSPGTQDAWVVRDGGPADSAMPWRAPEVSQVRMTGSSCLSVSPQAGGRCGGHYCGVTEAVLAPEIDPSKPCGNVAAYICTGELETSAGMCAEKAHRSHVVALSLGDIKGFAADVKTCLAGNTQIMNAGVRESCQSCFAQAHVCCAGNFECGAACLDSTGTAACDQAMSAAGCISPLFACAGLPNPF